MDAAKQVRHVAVGSCQVGNREQRALQGLGVLELLVRLVQVLQLQRAAQVDRGETRARRERVQYRRGHFVGKLQQKRCAVVVESHVHAPPLDAHRFFGRHQRGDASHVGPIRALGADGSDHLGDVVEPHHDLRAAAEMALDHRHDRLRGFPRRSQFDQLEQALQLYRVG
ncbi:MAG TPA: hypothetical protein VFS55_01235 [Dokdonella sp.]|nr:hypothetical protein [Dokdonella sp.]